MKTQRGAAESQEMSVVPRDRGCCESWGETGPCCWLCRTGLNNEWRNLCVSTLGYWGLTPQRVRGWGAVGTPAQGESTPNPWDTLAAPGAPWSCIETSLGGDGENSFWNCMWLPGMWGKAGRAPAAGELTRSNKPEPSSLVAGTWLG